MTDQSTCLHPFKRIESGEKEGETVHYFCPDCGKIWEADLPEDKKPGKVEIKRTGKAK